MDIKVYTPDTIPDQPFSEEKTTDVPTTQVGVVYSPEEIPDTVFPALKTAQELISASLNTKSQKILAQFKFTKYGAIQVGDYVSGVSGDIKISPSGIVGRNTSGLETFALDGETGDAVFMGTVTASTITASNVLTGQLDVGTATGGAYVRLDGANNRMIVHDGTNPRIVIGNV